MLSPLRSLLSTTPSRQRALLRWRGTTSSHHSGRSRTMGRSRPCTCQQDHNKMLSTKHGEKLVGHTRMNVRLRCDQRLVRHLPYHLAKPSLLELRNKLRLPRKSCGQSCRRLPSTTHVWTSVSSEQCAKKATGRVDWLHWLTCGMIGAHQKPSMCWCGVCVEIQNVPPGRSTRTISDKAVVCVSGVRWWSTCVIITTSNEESGNGISRTLACCSVTFGSSPCFVRACLIIPVLGSSPTQLATLFLTAAM